MMMVSMLMLVRAGLLFRVLVVIVVVIIMLVVTVVFILGVA